MIGLVDYEAGNLFSVRRAVEAVGGAVRLVVGPDDLVGLDRVILPGVGAFGSGLATLRARGLDEALRAFLTEGGGLLGICLGMQLLCTDSDERGHHAGLGWFEAPVRHLPPGVRAPHMGWHELRPTRDNELVPEPFYAYFAHSYAVPAAAADAVAAVEHGAPIAAALQRDRVWAVQFHPEKSGQDGLALIARFLEARWR